MVAWSRSGRAFTVQYRPGGDFDLSARCSVATCGTMLSSFADATNRRPRSAGLAPIRAFARLASAASFHHRLGLRAR